MEQVINNQYWKIWAVSVLVLIAFKAVLEVVLNENTFFVLFILYILPVWTWVMYLNYKKAHDLTAYLKKHHHEKWKEITHVPFFGAGGFNSFKSLPFIFSEGNLNDDNIKLLKRSYINFIKFALLVIITAIPLFLLVMVPWQR